MNISSQIGNIVYATTTGFQALMDDDLELAEEFMAAASKLLTGNTDMAVSYNELKRIEYANSGRTVRIPSQLPEKCFAIINKTGGITYMLAEEY